MLAPGTLPANAVLQLKCRGNGQLAWIDVPHNSTLYVLKDTTVEFKVESNGGAAILRSQINYQTAQRGGTAIHQDIGATKPIRFTANSANTNSPSTVTVAFGGQNLQGNVIVYTLNTVATPADTWADRPAEAEDLGVDERVSLSFTTTPAGVTAANAGGLQWKIGGGAAANRNETGLLQDANAHRGAPANDGLADYIAPCRIAQANANSVQTLSSKEVTLQLAVVTGPSIGLGPARKFRVHRANAHMRRLNGPPHHIQNLPTAGFFGEIFFTPKNVSFRTLRWREGTGLLAETGELAGATPQNLRNHAPSALADNRLGRITNGQRDGCTLVYGQDMVRGGRGQAFTPPARSSRLTEVGTQKWPITWEYTYAALDPANPNGPPANAAGNWTNDWIGMQIAHHVGKTFQNGRYEIFKGHVGCSQCMTPISCDLGDPTFWP